MITTTSSTDSPRPSRHRRRWMAAAVAFAVALAVGAGYALARDSGDAGDADQQAMAARAASVMPFDLEATTHTFTKNTTGGIEQIVANDPRDEGNISLVRQHLQGEADQFAEGDYSDPATIHGTTMPGLQELQAAGDRVQIRYQQVPSGARITYTSSDPVLVAALHAWFDAQNSDHAMPGMGMGN